MQATPAIATLIDSLAPHAIGWSLVVTRLAGMVVIAPLVSSMMIPMRVRALVCILLAAAAYPMLTRAEVGGVSVSTDLYALIPLMLAELLVGFIIGAIAAVPLLMMEMAGVIAGTTMGLGLARVYDPTQDAEVDLLGQFFFFIAMAIFLSVGGLESLFRGLLDTFHRVPAGATTAALAGAASGTELFTGVVASGMDIALRVSAPVIAIVFLVIIMMGVLGKTMPAMNVLTIGFAIKALLGVFMIALGLYAIREPIAQAIQNALTAAGTWIEQLGKA
jgi:flagellar biosynthetic protein FliR